MGGGGGGGRRTSGDGGQGEGVGREGEQRIIDIAVQGLDVVIGG